MGRKRSTSSGGNKPPSRHTPPPPPTPGEEVRQLLSEYDITQDELATALGVSRLSVNQLINSRRSVTAEMAIRLSKVFSTSPEFWLNLQRGVDVYHAYRRIGVNLNQVKVLREAVSSPLNR